MGHINSLFFLDQQTVLIPAYRQALVASLLNPPLTSLLSQQNVLQDLPLVRVPFSFLYLLFLNQFIGDSHPLTLSRPLLARPPMASNLAS